MTASNQANNSTTKSQETRENKLNENFSEQTVSVGNDKENKPFKNVDFGAVEEISILDDDDQDGAEFNNDIITQQNNSTSFYRRSSVSSNFGQKSSIAPLEFNNDKDGLSTSTGRPNKSNFVIPPPIPESLPTTPGYELGGDSYFNSNSKDFNIPIQQIYTNNQENISTNNIDLQNVNSILSKEKTYEVSGGMTLDNPPRNKLRLISCLIWVFTLGISDSLPGTLLPRIEAYYNISYSVVSTIWLANALGFIIIAILSHRLEHFLGKRIMIAGGCATSIIMYIFVAPGYKFPMVVVGFFFGGLGLATCLSELNIFLSRFKKSSKYLGFFHGFYGLGACIGPIISTVMIDHGIQWNYVYCILIGLTVVNIFDQWFAFKNADEDLKPFDNPDANEDSTVTTPTSEDDKELGLNNNQEQQNDDSHHHHHHNLLPSSRLSVEVSSILSDGSGTKKLTSDPIEMGIFSQKTMIAHPDLQKIPTHATHITHNTHAATDSNNIINNVDGGLAPESSESAPLVSESPEKLLGLALRSPITWFISFFVLFYQGGEVSIGGWIVTFLETYRHGDERTTGYVASGFWGGLTIGRIFLTSFLHKNVGAKRGVSILSLCAIASVILAWVVPIIIVEAVFISICGIFIGPIYPLMITVAVRILPRKIQIVSLTIMTAFGSSGGALFPFLVGIISQFAGTYIVFPVFIALFCAMLVLWYLLPNPDRNIIKHFWERVW
ncbi:hypothetical protein BVG19_g569 [[Candida] boidinii]|nr:hypothetical protein BVG19_g569 [[Candida] boidinii]OWB51478.1 hypothetical protein B5S27_g3041 [[Candida] boidinii]OWB65578.1 hypothetical protein B5S30_g904 [[Candida] boidinii]